MVSNSRLIVVLGMHRSGTSAITRGLQVLNANLGDVLIDAVPNNNEKGFWEDKEINAFNNALLEKLNSGWDHLTLVEESQLIDSQLAEEHNQAVALLQSKIQSEMIFAFKDPRTTVLLPFWKRVFQALELTPEYVIAVRHPLEVAESLKKRDGFSLMKGMMLWFKYNWCALSNTLEDKRIFVSYSALLESPVKQLARISKVLGFPPPESNAEALDEYAKVFLSTDLRHHNAATNIATEIPTYVLEMFHLLSRLARANQGKISKQDTLQWSELNDCFISLKPLLRELDQSYLHDQNTTEGQLSRDGVHAALYFAEYIDSTIQPYSESRRLIQHLTLDSEGETIDLVFPDDIERLANLRLDIANARVAIFLKTLSLHHPDGDMIWQWDGRIDCFTNRLGVWCVPHEQGAMLLCLNNDPQFNLGVPAAVLALICGGMYLRLNMSAKPLNDTLPQEVMRYLAINPEPDLDNHPTAVNFSQQNVMELTDLFAQIASEIKQKNAVIKAQDRVIQKLITEQRLLNGVRHTTNK